MFGVAAYEGVSPGFGVGEVRLIHVARVTENVIAFDSSGFFLVCGVIEESGPRPWNSAVSDGVAVGKQMICHETTEGRREGGRYRMW